MQVAGRGDAKARVDLTDASANSCDFFSPSSSCMNKMSGGSLHPSVGSDSSSEWTPNDKKPLTRFILKPMSDALNVSLLHFSKSETALTQSKVYNIMDSDDTFSSTYDSHKNSAEKIKNGWTSDLDKEKSLAKTHIIKHKNGDQSSIWIYSFKNKDLTNTSSSCQSEVMERIDTPRLQSVPLYIPTLNLESQNFLETVHEVVESAATEETEVHPYLSDHRLGSVKNWINNSLQSGRTSTNAEENGRNTIYIERHRRNSERNEMKKDQTVQCDDDVATAVHSIRNKRINTELSVDHNMESTFKLVPFVRKNYYLVPWDVVPDCRSDESPCRNRWSQCCATLGDNVSRLFRWCK